ncbi:hypothetical protein AMTR_s00042p00225140 [Amborella trichopoda]|uniref:Uncharacterized protein n=1 Tax=Amborella trichopoda TaxID=13333 RepID=W1P6R7_AMBTC|nr:hypothetical protein AMTR_s00042p00225140 [Amborella trichopoda]
MASRHWLGGEDPTARGLTDVWGAASGPSNDAWSVGAHVAPTDGDGTRGPHCSQEGPMTSCGHNFSLPMPKSQLAPHSEKNGIESSVARIWSRKRIGGRNKKGCDTRTSQEVTHPSTTLAQARLTSEI